MIYGVHIRSEHENDTPVEGEQEYVFQRAVLLSRKFYWQCDEQPACFCNDCYCFAELLPHSVCTVS